MEDEGHNRVDSTSSTSRHLDSKSSLDVETRIEIEEMVSSQARVSSHGGVLMVEVGRV